MLHRLSISNYALINSLDIRFDSGLNIVTGETGAGKSIILGALSLILGQRAERQYFFNEDRKCVIEGVFDLSGYALQDFFVAQDLDYDPETIIRREINSDGKSRAFVNDTPVTLQVLKALAEKLIDIHSQHATLQLNTPAFQLLVLDSVAQNQALRQQYIHQFHAHRKAWARLEALQEATQQANAEADYHQFLYDELEAARLEADEQERLELEQRQLEHAEEIKRGLINALYALRDQEINALALLRETQQQLQQAERYLPALGEQAARLQSSLIDLKDLGEELSRTEQEVLLDEGRLTEVNERLSQLYALQQKHHVSSVTELITLRETLRGQLHARSADEAEMHRLTGEVAELKAGLLTLAAELSEARKAAIPMVEKTVSEVLHTVGMPHGVLHVALQPLGTETMKESGGDDIQFLFTSNKGQDPQPVGKVASGGELSRLMLAVKSLVAQTSALPTIVFDEIDTGISGEVALRVGEIMERLGSNMQVIAITHLPQIAARGHSHFKVYKAESSGKTITGMMPLQPADRVLEIAQMLSGAEPGEAAMQHAAALLNNRA
ncbi:DNA repair protein RecN [Parapedobacter lycopersici]|uniref:DNA repair protein RecN n=1 Tax=Parapedobacter lycopersici TaxID=1864939 RepID=UPI00214DEC53|nr:DNA repair protein RecN [Parapedobacter lycopersici]